MGRGWGPTGFAQKHSLQIGYLGLDTQIQGLNPKTETLNPKTLNLEP